MIRVVLMVVLVASGCAQDPATMTTTPTTTCVVANALMGTGSQSIIGTKTVTAIYDSTGKSITEDPGGRVVVGQSPPGINGWQLAGAVTGPTSGSCTAPIKITTPIGETTVQVTYTVDATAVWPATVTP